MTEARFRAELANSVRSFEEQLAARGFVRESDRTWRGDVPVPNNDGSESSVTHVVKIPADFPFEPPEFFPQPRPSDSCWHMESNGRLCLYGRRDGVGRPWDDIEAMFAKVGEWHRQTALGWPDELGDMDLERYFDRHKTDMLLVYEDLDALVGRRLKVKVRSSTKVVTVERKYRLGDKSRRRSRKADSRGTRSDDWWGAGVSLGVLNRPVSDWSSLVAAMSAGDRAAVTALARVRSFGIVVAKYGRSTKAGELWSAIAVLIEGARDRSGEEPVASALSVENRSLARLLRRGADAPVLASRSVAVIGVGAVGSFLAEHLARSGVGSLTLVDKDRLRYGNCARHLADEQYVNREKVAAVKELLVDRSLMDKSNLETMHQSLTFDIAIDLFAGHDLVVDSTADSRVFDILTHASRLTGEEWVKAGIHRAGAVLRVDRFGPGTAPPDRRLPPVLSTPGTEGSREDGCGDPVSATPPLAVERAASLACAYAIDTMLRRRRDRHYQGDTRVEVLSPNDGPVDGDPYSNVGIISG